MTARSQWRLMTFGPGAAVVAFGVVVFLVRDVFVALPYVILGVALILTAGTQVSAYRAGYWRGRFEVIDELSRTGEPGAGPPINEPSPWDQMPTGRRRS